MTEPSPPQPPKEPAAPAHSGDPVPPQPGEMPDPIARMAEDIRTRDAELVALRQALYRAEIELEALHRSTSWRVTAPLRAIVRVLRGKH